MPHQVTVQRTINAGATELYELVADLPRMGDWSPENTGGRWVNGATGPVVGARFKGTNKKGFVKWTTDVVVTVAEPGQRFGFDVNRGPIKISNWDYRFQQEGANTVVVETWTDRRRSVVVGMLVGWVIGVRDRRVRNREIMAATLAKLATAVEG